MHTAAADIRRFALGAACLFLGAVLYLVVRPAGASGEWLGVAPTFLHVVAMILLVAALWPPSRRGALFLCVAWFAINVFFELGQHPALSAVLAQWLGGLCGEWAGCRRGAQFFLRGVFDTGDLLAAGAGALAAWWLLARTAARGSAP